MLQYTDNSLLLSVYYVIVYCDTLFKFSLYIYLYMAITYYTTYTACDCHILLFTLTTISDIAAISILVIFPSSSHFILIHSYCSHLCCSLNSDTLAYLPHTLADSLFRNLVLIYLHILVGLNQEA